MPDAPLYYPSPLPQGALAEGQIILKDGSTAELRPVRNGDRELLLEFLRRVSGEARARRFFGAVSPESAAEQLLKQGMPEEHLALVVVSGGPADTRIIAHGKYIRDGADAAEVAFIVADGMQGKGLGTLLLERLALVAWRQGIRHFYGPTEASNRQMRALFRESGFNVQEDRDGSYVDVSFSILPSRDMVERFEAREREATVASLRPFFRPRAVAVVGASRDPESIGYLILRALVLNRFDGPVYPVNKRAEVVGSVPAYASLEEVPGPVDLAVIVVPLEEVVAAVEDCGKKGVRSLVVISAGFAEAGEAGLERQNRLLGQARGYGMRIVGPNCLGLLNTHPEVRLNASFSPTFPPHGPVALASQSGALGLAVLDLATQLGLGLSSFVSLGNGADVSGNDLIQYWEDDPDTRVILLYLETFGNPRRFARLARRIGRKKPILVVKAGRSQVGRHALSPHALNPHVTALSADETAVEALFHQAGIVRAETLEEMFDVATLFAGQALPRGDLVGIVTNARGPALLAVDALQAAGLSLTASATSANPVTLPAAADAEAYRLALEALLADPDCHALLVIFVPVGLATTERVAAAVREAVAAARATGVDKPVLACFMASEEVGEALSPAGERVPRYRFPEAAARALARARQYAAWREAPLGVTSDFVDLEVDKAREVCRGVQGGWLSPPEVATVLSAFGISLAAGETVRTPDEAVAAAARLGYPVVVKLASRTLQNKSEWDGVKLDLQGAAAVRGACEAIANRLGQVGKLSELEGFLVQKMVTGGVEVMVGMTLDRLFGPLVAFGLGGVHVEILRDVVFRITPLTDCDAVEMVTSIRGYPLLQGYRGSAEADVGALETLLLRVSRLVEELPEITELEFNPVKALAPGQGCLVLDARIRVSSHDGHSVLP